MYCERKLFILRSMQHTHMHRMSRLYSVFILNMVVNTVGFKLCKVKSEIKLIRRLKVFTVRLYSLCSITDQGPATGHFGTGFSWSPRVYKRMLKWFQRLQVATVCFSRSPPDLNFLVPYFIFMYMHNNHCHRVTAQLQLINIIIIIMFYCVICVFWGGG